MSSTTSGIEWTDATWNPVTGCSKVSPGCTHCYAEVMARRLAGMGKAGYSALPWTARNAAEVVVMRPERLGDPLRWRKPRRVFVNSMSDLFHEQVPFKFIAAVFAVMAYASTHTFQVLTKRPERMREFMRWVDADDKALVIESGPAQQKRAVLRRRVHCIEDRLANEFYERTADGVDLEACLHNRGRWPLPNVWLGTSVEGQRWTPRIDELVQTPAAVHFVSCEPLLEHLDISPWLRPEAYDREGHAAGLGPVGLEWVIVGGESGPGARPMDIGWARGIVEQVRAAGVAAFVKQLGARPMLPFTEDGQREWNDRAGSGLWQAGDGKNGSFWRDAQGARQGLAIRLRDRKGGDMAEWPADLRVREFPAAAIEARS